MKTGTFVFLALGSSVLGAPTSKVAQLKSLARRAAQSGSDLGNLEEPPRFTLPDG